MNNVNEKELVEFLDLAGVGVCLNTGGCIDKVFDPCSGQGLTKQTLLSLLLKAKEVYYRTKDSILTDQQYDALEMYYKFIVSEKEWSSFNGGIGIKELENSGFKKVKHRINMGSLNKAVNIDEMRGWYSNRAKELGVD